MKDLFEFFCVFIFFNSIFGLSGLALIGGAIYIIIVKKFNSLSFVMIVIGIIIFLIFFLGIKTKKKNILLAIYLIFVVIILLLYGFLSFMIKVFPDELIDYLKKKVNDIKDEDIDKIKNHNINLFIITLNGTIFSLFAFISGIIYYKKLKKKNTKIDQDLLQGDDILQGNDNPINHEEDNNINNSN